MRRSAPGATAARTGQVVAAFGRSYGVALEQDVTLVCVTRGRRHDIACGDHVSVVETAPGTGVIESVAPRTALFYRSDAWREKLIAANVTQVVIVIAGKPMFSEDLVSRCLVAAEHSGTRAVIVLNKIDLPDAAAARQRAAPLAALGYPMIELAAKRDLAPLAEVLAGQLSLLVGQSGMGKSTIINGLVPDAAARVAEVSVALGSGRHTTTSSRLYRIDSATAIIDSPGIQEFGLKHVAAEACAQAFVEFREHLGSCRFRDCHHLSEPDCAIAAACSAGRIAESRLASYRRLMQELVRGS